jgi:hypothetical protein
VHPVVFCEFGTTAGYDCCMLIHPGQFFLRTSRISASCNNRRKRRRPIAVTHADHA